MPREMLRVCGAALSANRAIAEFALFDPAQGSVDSGTLTSAATLLGKRHGLHLHGVKPRQSDYAVLF